MNLPNSLGNPGHWRLVCAAFTWALTLALPVRADLIELTNGDHYRGTVISMTLTNVEFQSEIQGRVKLPRDKIAQITLHDVVAKPVVVAKPAAAVGAPMILPGSGTNAAPAGQADAVAQQMRQQGVDPKLIDQVQQQIIGKGSPEAAQKFNELMGGLMTGSLSMRDIRAQAQNSIAQIKAAKQELGAEAGDMLDSYLAILEKFVQEAAADTASPAPQPAPPGASIPPTPTK